MELELPHDFKELFEFLNAHKVEYLLLGGYAVIAYGYVPQHERYRRCGVRW